MIVIVMGVSGCGKSTVGKALAAKLGWTFIDADDHHPAANIGKMRAGIPLTDADRWPWLDQLNHLLTDIDREGGSAVLACSALKQAYRIRLTNGLPEVRLVHLSGSYDEVMTLMARRTGHFMMPQMLASQFEALEVPTDALSVPVLISCADQVKMIMGALGPGE